MSALAHTFQNLLKAGSASERLANDVVIAAESALRGGLAALPFYKGSELDVEGLPRGPVTAADRASHKAISEYLSAHCPNDAMLSEEESSPAPRPKVARMWVVDPLDGTREFIDQIGEFSVMVGLVENGRAMLGAVYRPDRDVMYVGVLDQGAWRVENASSEISVSRLTVDGHEGRGLRFIRSRSHPDERLRKLEESLAPVEVILSGSVGTKCALIAEGRADVYVHPVPYLKEWDTCAPEAVLRGAGGYVTDCRGKPLEYGKMDSFQPHGIFAAHPVAWSQVSATVFDAAKEL